jgi:alpha-beta hydrolase superfamily lysophospholipase
MTSTAPTSRYDFTLEGHAGELHGRRWLGDQPASWIALLCHGYGEHVGRYEWVAERLVADGAAVYAIDHVGHGQSAGERVVIDDFDRVVDDFRLLEQHAAAADPALPVVLIGHSMGGMIAVRYAQRYPDDLACVVLSGPVLGSWAPVTALLNADVIPDSPIDPSTLSRDSEVGRAYVDDPLVWHGPFKQPTIQALDAALRTISTGGPVDVPMLWLHGEDDQLVPYDATAAGWPAIAGPTVQTKTYPDARHEIFNETNREEVLADVTAFVRQYR